MKLRELMEGPGKKRTKLREAGIRELVDGVDLIVKWRLGGYDGMCTGICEVDGEMCYLMVPVSYVARHRMYVAVALTSEQRQEHLLYREAVLKRGFTHLDFEYVDGRRKYGEYVKGEGDHIEAYKSTDHLYPIRDYRGGWAKNYGDNEIVGWWEA